MFILKYIEDPIMLLKVFDHSERLFGFLLLLDVENRYQRDGIVRNNCL